MQLTPDLFTKILGDKVDTNLYWEKQTWQMQLLDGKNKLNDAWVRIFEGADFCKLIT